jgi:phosphonate transport system ATP-binding protein
MSHAGDESQSALLEVRDLSMTFEGNVVALDRISLEVRSDEFLIVLGPSGAGKSTLLRSLNRLNHPTGGQVRFRGQDVTHVAGAKLRQLRQHVGMIFQQFNLVGRLSVLQNVLAGRLCFARFPLGQILSHMYWLSREDQDIALDALRQVGVESLAHRRASTLSGGQQQRIAIARLLAQQPEVILADEPIASLDPRSAEVVMDVLQEIHRSRGIPVVINLHQVEIARRYATRLIGMRAGRIVFDGSPEAFDPEMAAQVYDGKRLHSSDPDPDSTACLRSLSA